MTRRLQPAAHAAAVAALGALVVAGSLFVWIGVPLLVLKTTLYGAIIAVVSCYKGMTASGGAEGVGRAVNQGVVIAFLGIFAFNYVFTQTLLATHPEISVIK